MNWGMITWQVPLKRYPDTYNKQPLAFVALAAQKNNYALYLMCATRTKRSRSRCSTPIASWGASPTRESRVCVSKT